MLTIESWIFESYQNIFVQENYLNVVKNGEYFMVTMSSQLKYVYCH